MPRCRPVPSLASLVLLLAGCGGGDPPCLIDSDCADFTRVCIDGFCTQPGGSRDSGPARDSGPGTMTDSGGPTDAGDTPTDAEPSDAATADAGDAAAAACTDLSGAWRISALVAMPCGGAMVDYVANITPGATACTFDVASSDALMPTADGSFLVDSTDTFVPASSTISLGGDTAVSCTGNLAGGSVLTMACAPCTVQLQRVP